MLLQCDETGSRACILDTVGNTLCSFAVGDKEAIYFPDSPDSYLAHNKLAGSPLLHPWSNRLEGNFFWWRGQRYILEDKLVPMRDANYLPLHGLLYKSPNWKTTRLEAHAAFAIHEAQLDFARYGEYLSQFPFAHTLTLRHWLEQNTLTIELVICNTGEREMPICSGFHPYFSFAGHEREHVQLSLPVTERFVTDRLLLPTGECAPVIDFVPGEYFPLQGRHFDEGFRGLLAGRAFGFRLPDKEIEVQFGDNFPVAVVYAPDHPDKPYVCIEPMAAPTNALQLDHHGRYSVSSLEPGEEWRGWFSVRIL